MATTLCPVIRGPDFSTTPGQAYTLSFELAANLRGGHLSARVEVMWNGKVVDIAETTSGAYRRFETDIAAAEGGGKLEFHAIAPAAGQTGEFRAPLAIRRQSLALRGRRIEATTFAPGQPVLYRLINGQLHAYDPMARTFDAIGNAPGFGISAAAYNTFDDLIYGVATSAGTDAAAQTIAAGDIVAIDATGANFRVGAGLKAFPNGGFDEAGKFWTFNSRLDRARVFEIEPGTDRHDPSSREFEFPARFSRRSLTNLAYDMRSGIFYAVAPPRPGETAGALVTIDVRTVRDGGAPAVSELPIEATFHGQTVFDGLEPGTIGPLYMDADGHIYLESSPERHCLARQGRRRAAIYRINMDMQAGAAFAVFVSEIRSTGPGSGTMDPRASDPLATPVPAAPVLLRNAAIRPRGTLAPRALPGRCAGWQLAT